MAMEAAGVIGGQLLTSTVNTVPGAYYAGLAQQQFNAGNYGTAAIYGAVSFGDAMGVATLGLATRAQAGLRAGATAIESTTLFRAVGLGELADIQSTGVFRNLGSAEGTYFTSSAESAAFYAKQAVSTFGDSPYTLIRTQVPTALIKTLSQATVDRGIPAFVIQNEQLKGLVPQILMSMPIPR
ncbi:hypothetical protein J2Y55_003208 [Bosea sp. BE125]|uniref:hypothetical protein n=1 Tax=Bosea sp. BE125 TaxID=2817909 RepID=UPI00285F0AF3|nr:hypothetical protein [Bosea sp. BE125]MDR6872192.1 hypothetical protein [Bosea sp. BE125]